jgi:hypothetical protein
MPHLQDKGQVEAQLEVCGEHVQATCQGAPRCCVVVVVVVGTCNQRQHLWGSGTMAVYNPAQVHIPVGFRTPLAGMHFRPQAEAQQWQAVI